MNNFKKNISFGIFSAAGLLILYLFILSAANSPSHAFSQFGQIWYWILILAVGFGAQVGLYVFIRDSVKIRARSPRSALTASGGISTGSMVVCCLHHLADVLPIMGLAAAAVFLTRYQTFFLIIGVIANVIGVIIMLEFIQKNNLSEGLSRRILVWDFGKIKKAAFALASLVILAAFLSLNNPSSANKQASATSDSAS